MPENASLSAKQQQAIASLVAGKTVAEAASDSHVNEATIYRWKKEPAFKDGLHQAKGEILDQALGKLVRYTGAAIDTLARNLVNDTGASASIRAVQVKAAQAILEASINVHRSDEVDRRLEALEQQEQP